MPPPDENADPRAPDVAALQARLAAALEEDLGPGDVTTAALVEANRRARALILARQPGVVCGLPLVEPLLRGRDLLALGMSPGPEVGKLLRLIREKQLAQELTTREQALAFAKAYLQNQGSLRKDGTPNDQSFHSKESPESHSTL